MFKHVYPAWHKPAQRGLFVIGAALCITLPAIYGSSHRPRKISATTMGAVFGAYFGVWALFSLLVRFLIPSPIVELSLPTYNPSPIPEPVVLYSPSRADAVPNSPAIRLHPSTAGAGTGAVTVTGTGGAEETTANSPAGVSRGARFADDSLLASPEDAVDSPSTTSARNNNVTFQTRSRGYTTDSNNSEAAYPTYAAYRQSQHGNFEAFTQRIKKAFTSQQQQQQQEQLEQQQQQQQQQVPMQQTGGSDGVRLQSLVPGASHNINASTTSLASSARSRSTSTGSLFGDLAERIRGASLFTRSQNLLPTRASTDLQGGTPNSRRSSAQARLSTGALARLAEAGGSNAEIPAIEIMMVPSAYDRGLGTEDESYGRVEPMALSNAVPFPSERDREKKGDEKRSDPRRRSSDDTVVVNIDGIRRPTVN